MAEGGIGVEIKQPVQENATLVKEVATTSDDWFNLFYRAGKATERRLAGTPSVNPQKVGRSLHTRVERARLFKGLVKVRALKKDLPPEIKVKVDWAEINNLKQDLDAFDRQILNQGRLAINLSGLGVQEAQYAVIDLSKNKENAEIKPPIFLVPALAADLNGTAPLLREASLQGRKVIIVGYPESFRGKTTLEFAKALEDSPNFEPYTTYFKKAIEALVGQEGDLELWGYSVGGGIVTELLHDPKFQARVTNAVIVAPAGCVDQSKWDIKKGLAHEAKEIAKYLRGIHDSAITYGLREPFEEGQKKLRDRIVDFVLYNKIGRRISSWEGMRVKAGGKIIVATGRKDEITKSYKINQQLLNIPNSQIVVIDDPYGSHVTPETQAEVMVKKIAEIRDDPQAASLTVI